MIKKLVILSVAFFLSIASIYGQDQKKVLATASIGWM